MRVLSPAVHRILDFVTVAAFAVAPTLLHLTGVAAMLAYALAVIHLALTLLTHVPGGGQRPVPFRAHGMIELAVGIALPIAALVLGWEGAARAFFIGAGVVILAVWLLSAYDGAAAG